MQTHLEFVAGMERIYDAFRQEQMPRVAREGVVADPNLVERRGGYLVALRYPADVAETVGAHAERVRDATGAMAYDAANLHATLATMGVAAGFAPNDATLARLATHVHAAIVDGGVRMTNAFGPWLYNRECVIVPGIPDRAHHALRECLTMEGLKPAALAHLTANRFTQAKDPKELAEFFSLMHEAPSVRTAPAVALDVGYFRCGATSFDVTVYERFALRK